MVNRRCLHALIHHASAFLSSTTSLSSLQSSLPKSLPLKTLTSKFPHILPNSEPIVPTCCNTHCSQSRHFSSNRRDDDDDDSDHEEDDEDDDIDDEEEMGESGEDESVSGLSLKREYTVEEKETEAAAIGYKVIGPLDRSDRVFKPYEPVFAVVQIGSHQFKVSNGDCVFSERLKFCEVNDKLILNKVLLLGSSSQTIVGRPIVPDAVVHAVVEEHALDAKVIIFKKKRRKNYRRTKGHRQELTKLRITDIQGIEKPENTVAGKPSKAAVKKPEKVAVAA